MDAFRRGADANRSRGFALASLITPVAGPKRTKTISSRRDEKLRRDHRSRPCCDLVQVVEGLRASQSTTSEAPRRRVR